MKYTVNDTEPLSTILFKENHERETTKKRAAKSFMRNRI